MSPLFGKKCNNCGFENGHEAKFCASCGAPLPGSGGRICGSCKAENRQDAVYCKNCGLPLATNEDVKVQHNHWARREGDFAARLDINDLPGLLSKTLEVEDGTQALVYARGVPQEILPPGAYTMDSIGMKISNWVKGVPTAATVLLVDIAPTELVVHIEKRFTSDPLPVNLTMRLVVAVENAGKFLLAALHGRERYSINELRSYVEPEVNAIADLYIRQHTLEQLVQNPSTRKELELAVEEGLRSTFNQYGLVLRSLRTAELDLQAQDKINGIKGNYTLLAQEGEAEYAGQALLDDLKNKVDLHALSQEFAKVELEERKVDLYQRIRQTAQSDKMNEVTSEYDFEKFIDDIDRQKLLSSKERQDLLKGWKEAGEDHDRARSFLLAKADVEEKYNLKAIEIKSKGDLDLQEQDYLLELERVSATKKQQIEEQKWQFELTKRKAEFELDTAEAREGIDLLIELKRKKSELQNEIDEHALKMRLDEARANVDREILMMETQHRFEMERIEQLGKVGTDVLISVSPHDQAQILADLKRSEILKGMTEDQILAMAAEKSPDVARVFEEKYRAIAEGKATEREKELYERLLTNSKDNQQMLIDVQKEFMLRQQQMSQHDVDAIRDVSIAYAQKASDPVIIAAGGGSITAAGRGSKTTEQEETKTCPGCGRQVPVASRFCEYCANEFKDVK